MADKDIFAERGRSLEEDYFRKKDRELIEKMRRAATADQARADMGQKIGVTDPEMLQELDALGFTPDTVVLLPLVPAVQMAWAEGGVTPAERSLLVKLARSRGIEAGSTADRKLESWLDAQPSPQIFENATRLIRAMLASPGHGELTADDLVGYSESIATASGGILGINRVSAEERQLLTSLAEQLKK